MARPLAQEMRVQGSLTGELQNLIYDLLPTLEELEAKPSTS
ncbi:hypothetical protein [Mesorhizobium sp. J428]|nr:hypothetical protein [Mesorhizobium sp. J428]